MPDMNLHPADLLSRAASRIRWQQHLLCGFSPERGIEVSEQGALGLYYTLEDIYEDVTAAIRGMEGKNRA